MHVTPALLSETRVFRGVDIPPEAAALWAPVSLATGMRLWAQDAPAHQIGILIAGRLAVRVGDEVVASIAPGELVGESSAFVRADVRTGDVVAESASELVVLGSADLATLRNAFPAIYDALLERALVELSERIVATDHRIQRLVLGDRDAPLGEGVIAWLWRRMTGKPPGPPPSVRGALLSLPVVAEASEDVIQGLIPMLLPRFVEKGTALFLEGEVGDTLYLVATGRIEVLRGSEPGRVHTLASLPPGSLFGTGAVLGHGRRVASCVAEEDAWVFSMDRIAYNAQSGELGRVWREALLHALRSQILGADRALAKLQAELRTGAAHTAGLDAAAGEAVAWRAPER